MEQTIFKAQLEKQVLISTILNKYRGTPEWEKSRLAFHEIIRASLHSDKAIMSDAELDEHFERALVTTEEDVHMFSKLSAAALGSERDASSPYYLVNVGHYRRDNFFETNPVCPVTGAGKQKLRAKFEAQNLYQKYPINATAVMPPRVQNSPFPAWADIVAAMTDRATFDKTFYLTNAEQANAVFAVTSAQDWSTAQGQLFMTPTLFGNTVFSPALYSVYFFGNIFFFVTADGQGNAEKPFVGLVNAVTEPESKVYDSVNRFSFTYISSKDNLAKYWLDMNDDKFLDFNIGIQLFYPDHPTSPYIDVNAAFSAQASVIDVAFFRDTLGLATILLLQKGTLMRDLIGAYFPGSSSAQLWIDVGALTKGPKWKEDLGAIGLNVLSDLFALHVWKEKPTVVTL